MGGGGKEEESNKNGDGEGGRPKFFSLLFPLPIVEGKVV